MMNKHFLNFPRIKVFTSSNNQIFYSSNNLTISIWVNYSNIPKNLNELDTPHMDELLRPKNGGGALCVQMGFTRTFQANTKCNNINHVWSHFYKFLVVLKYHRRPWANIFDTDIFRCTNTYVKVVYLAFFGMFMLLQMSVSKILADRRLWYFKTTKNLQKWIQTWFILLHMVLVWNVRVKFTKRAIVY